MMTSRMQYWRNALLVGFLAILLAGSAFAQDVLETRLPVTYVSVALIYVDGGRDKGVAVGDTLYASHGKLLVDAVARASTAAHLLDSTVVVAVGDFLILKKKAPILVQNQIRQDTAVSKTGATLKSVNLSPPEAPSNQNRVSGRVALQYIGVFSSDSRLDFNQPTLLTRLEVENLYGSGVRFSMYGRTYYNMSDNYKRNGDSSRLQFRPYEFLLENGDPNASFGYMVGRATSRYVSGLGTFDGGQMYYHQGSYTVGAIFGATVEDRDMSIDGDDKKGALFFNYRWLKDFSRQYEGTIAYARILKESHLDREFVYLQNSASLSQSLSFYQSSEFDLQAIDHGIRSSTFRMTNTFATMNVTPIQWLSLNLGYDASRSIYLFETMKSLPDTLFDNNLLHGYRLNFSVRLPASVTVGGTATYRSQSGDSRTSRTISGYGRISNLLQTELNGSVRYASISGIFSDGKDLTIDVDRTLFTLLSVSLRYDRYAYTLLRTDQRYLTSTLTLNASGRLSRSLYSVLAVDRVWDSFGDSYRLYAEMGLRF